MTYLTGEVTVVHDWTKIDFTNFVYSGFRFNGTAAGATTTINGATVSKIVGVTIDSVINENTTTIDEDLILLGNPQPTFSSNIKGASTGEYQSKYSFYFEGNDKRQFFNFGKPSSVNDLDSSITVSTYMRVDGDHSVDGYAIENYLSSNGFGLGYKNTGDEWRFRIGVTTSGLEDILTNTLSPKTTGANTWINITGTWNTDTKEMKIYVNGSLENTRTLALTDVLDPTTDDLRIGGGTTSTGEMKGMVNNIVIWNTALTDEEVLTHYNNGNPYNVLLDGPNSNNIVFWSKVGDNSSWNGSDQWTIIDAVNNFNGLSSTAGGGAFAPMTYTSRVKDAP
tara:strand:+ start:68 stop:1078 length:1011 start_codon:yes stop_codon:yes gene_type:complete